MNVSLQIEEPMIVKPETRKKREGFLNYINNFRGIAILFIIAGHCLQPFYNDMSSVLKIILQVLLQDGTVLFVFIAGYLFQHLSNKYVFSQYIKTKIKNVLLPYIIVSIPALIYVIFVDPINSDIYNQNKIIQSIYFLLTGLHLLPLWFIPMILLFYLASPLLLKFDKWKYFYYLLPLLIIISSIIPRDNTNTLQSFVHFFSVYVLGMFFSKQKDLILKFIRKNLVLLIVLFFSFVIFDIYNRIQGYTENNFLQLWSKLLLSGLLIYGLYRYDNLIKQKFNYLAQVSFGLFFIHYYVIMVLGKVFDKFFDLSEFNIIPLLISLIIFSILVTTISCLLIELAKKIFQKKSRLLIGC